MLENCYKTVRSMNSYTKSDLEIIDNLFNLDCDMISFTIENDKLILDKIIKKNVCYERFNDMMIFDFDRTKYSELSRDKLNDTHDIVFLVRNMELKNELYNHIICDIQNIDLFDDYKINTNYFLLIDLINRCHEQMYSSIENLRTNIPEINNIQGELNFIDNKGIVRKIIDVNVKSTCIFVFGDKLIMYENFIDILDDYKNKNPMFHLYDNIFSN